MVSFWGKTFVSNFSFQTLEHKLWIQKLNRMTIEGFKVKGKNRWDHTTTIYIKGNTCGDAQLNEAIPCRAPIRIHFDKPMLKLIEHTQSEENIGEVEQRSLRVTKTMSDIKYNVLHGAQSEAQQYRWTTSQTFAPNWTLSLSSMFLFDF